MDTINFLQDKQKTDNNIKIELCNKNETLSGELVLNAFFPAANDIDKGFYAIEDNYYSLKVTLDVFEEIEEIDLYLNDICLKTVYPNEAHYISENSIEIITDYDNCFSMCYDMSYLCVKIKLKSETECIYYSPYFVIATKAYLSELVSNMLYELETFNEGLLQSCFSKSLTQSSLKKNSSNNIFTILNKLEDIANVLKMNYKYFCINPVSKVGCHQTVVDINKVYQTDSNSIEWIAKNPESLVKVENRTDIYIENTYFIPQKILASTQEKVFNTYENEIILGFIWNICTFIDRRCNEFEYLINQSNMEEINSFLIPEDYEIPINIIYRQLYHQYSGIFKELSFLREQFRNQFILFSKALKCKPAVLDHRPKYTHTFREIKHYRSIFDCIIIWFDYGNYTLNGSAYLFKMKTIDKIYEFYSLCRIIKCLESLNFGFCESFYYEYERPNKDTDIPNTYHLNSNEYTLTLYYQPQIYSYASKANNGINLYRSDGGDFYEPDFLIKIVQKGRDQEYYCIFDSKFSSNYTISRHGVLEQEVMKYIVGIAGNNKHFSPVISMWLLLGKANKLIVNKYKRTIGLKESIPSIGVLSLSPEFDDSMFLKFFHDQFNLLQDIKDIV